MDWDRVEGNWMEYRGSARQQSAKLTDDQFTATAGNLDVPTGKVQEAHGVSREEAKKQLDLWPDALWEVNPIK
jgi:uncharacterized protein YjbJ (UPF0337 family)